MIDKKKLKNNTAYFDNNYFDSNYFVTNVTPPPPPPVTTYFDYNDGYYGVYDKKEIKKLDDIAKSITQRKMAGTFFNTVSPKDTRKIVSKSIDDNLVLVKVKVRKKRW